MFRISVLVLLAMYLACVCGCGGGSQNVPAPFIQILDTRVQPKVVNISTGQGVQWVNSTAIPQEVVSGTLDPQGNPLVIHIINITLTGFNPVTVLANLGDTIRFNNLTGSPFTMNIVDDNGQVVSTVSFAIGEMRTIVFPGAGLFIFRQQGSQIFQGTITLFGQPHPDNRFLGGPLTNGAVFSAQFNSPGTRPYYIPDLNNPNRSFITGTINVH